MFLLRTCKLCNRSFGDFLEIENDKILSLGFGVIAKKAIL